MSTLIDIGLLKPEDIVFYDAGEGFLGAKMGERDIPRVTVSRALPFSEPEKWLSIRDEEKHELGIIEDLAGFPQEQRTLLREALRLRYFSPEILELLSVRDKMGYLYIDARISGGERVFAVKDYSRNLRIIGNNRLMITDVEGNRYTIENMEAMDAKSRRRIEPYLL